MHHPVADEPWGGRMGQSPEAADNGRVWAVGLVEAVTMLQLWGGGMGGWLPLLPSHLSAMPIPLEERPCPLPARGGKGIPEKGLLICDFNPLLRSYLAQRALLSIDPALALALEPQLLAPGGSESCPSTERRRRHVGGPLPA